MENIEIKNLLIEIGKLVCNKVYHSLSTQSIEQLSNVHEEALADTIYQIDRDVEDLIIPQIEKNAQAFGGIVLIAEGISDGTSGVVFPKGSDPAKAKWRIIIDPIDGTRGIMYDKRSAFFLAGAALNKGESTTLQDIMVAVMTELPTSRGAWSDTLWAIKNQGAFGFSRNLFTNEEKIKNPSPSKATTIMGGFAQISRFFPPAKMILAQIEDELIENLFPDAAEGKALIFEDQYISSGGQLYEILMGHDRFVADIRTGLYARLKRENKKGGHCCHPYDLCAHMIGTEAGVIITDKKGNPLNAPLDTESSVDWIAYANKSIQKEVESELQKLMSKHGIY